MNQTTPVKYAPLPAITFNAQLLLFPTVCSLALARERKLAGAIGVESSPVALILCGSIFSGSNTLVGLIEGLEVENVESPVEGSTNATFEEGICVVGASLSGLITGTA